MPLVPTSQSQPLSKSEFHTRLREWIETTNESRVGDPDDDNRKPCAYISDGGKVFRLHSDTKRKGVEEYLTIVDARGDDLPWYIVESRTGKKVAVAFDSDSSPLHHFYLYLDS